MKLTRVVVTEEMVTLAYRTLLEEINPPYSVNVRRFTDEDVKQGKLKKADDEAEEMNRAIVRRALEAAYLNERKVEMKVINRIKPGLKKIENAWNENPLLVIGVATGAMMAASKLITSMSAVNNSRTWKKEVNRRNKIVN